MSFEAVETSGAVAAPVALAPGRASRRLRAWRIEIESPGPETCRVPARHGSLGPMAATAVNASRLGLCLVVDESVPNAPRIRHGDLLTEVVVDVPGGVVYRGTATVRWVGA